MSSLIRLVVATCATLVLASTINTRLLAQSILELHYRHVPQENVQKFVHLETTYWSEVARKAIDEGKMTGWALWQKTSGWDMDEGSNFLFFNVYPDKEHLNGRGAIWNAEAVFPNVRVEDISTAGISTVTNMLFLQGEGYVEKTPAQYIRINYAKASDVDRYVELEQTIWQPFIKEQMDAGKTDVTSWGVARLLVPNGASIPFNVITVDGFQTFSGTVQATWDPETQIPDLTPFNELANGFDRVQTYALVKSVWAEDM